MIFSISRRDIGLFMIVPPIHSVFAAGVAPGSKHLPRCACLTDYHTTSELRKRNTMCSPVYQRRLTVDLERREAQVSGSPLLAGDIGHDALHLLGREVESLCDLSRRYAALVAQPDRI